MKALNTCYLCMALFLIGINTAIANGSKDSLASTFQVSNSKSCFYEAKKELEDMLSGKIPLNYERAVFITENAYWNNELSYEKFQKVLDFQTKIIETLASVNDHSDNIKFKSVWFETAEEKKSKYKKNLTNAAIFNFITDTVYYVSQNKLKVHFPFQYPYNDPNGSNLWNNAQVLNLLSPYQAKGNCYAMTCLYKILAERLGVEANITTAPGHIFIEHKDPTGRSYNVELATASFPMNGSLETLTYTTDRAFKSGISMRTLDLKQSVGLCLVYLAKGYQHKFNNMDNSFMLECADLTLKNDSLNLNALLLKAEVMESRLIRKMEIKKWKTLKDGSTNNSFKNQLLEYEKVVTFLFNKGYKEMPMEMKNIFLSKLNNDERVTIGQDHTPQPFSNIGVKTNRYATLSNGLFDEMILDKPIEKISRTEFDTKKKRIIRFTEGDTTYNKYNLDPVVFAWNIDPLFTKFPDFSPYSAFANNPILFIDNDGREVGIKDPKTGETHIYVVGASAPQGASKFVQDTYEAINYLAKNPTRSGVNIVSNLVKSEFRLNIVETTEEYGAGFNSNFSTSLIAQSEIKFNTNYAAQFENGQIQSPITDLAHELDHANRYFKLRDLYYKTESDMLYTRMDEVFSGRDKINDQIIKEEQRATAGYERDIVKKLGQYIRTDYYSPKQRPSGMYKTDNVIGGTHTPDASPAPIVPGNGDECQ